MFKNIIISVIIISLSLNSVFSQQKKPAYCQSNDPNESFETNGMTLKMVQVITRHGDRTPVFTLPKTEMNQWDCDLSWLMVSSLENVPGPVSNVNRLFRKVYMPDIEIIPGNCSSGQLTKKGFNQHQNLGSKLNDLYVNKYKLFNDEDLDTMNSIFVRSTDVPRTFQSVQGHLTGLFPPKTLTETKIPVININTVDFALETMLANTATCPIIDQLVIQYKDSPAYTAFKNNNTQLQQKLFNKLGQFPAWNYPMDLFYSAQCHDLPLPDGITQENVDQVSANALFEYKNQLSYQNNAAFAMSTFLQEIVNNFKSFVNGTSTQFKYRAYSGHDETIAPMLSIFNLFNVWPPYASHIEIELWNNDKTNENYIQFKYNGDSYILKDNINNCVNHMCPIETFYNITNNIIVPNIEKECKATTPSSPSSSTITSNVSYIVIGLTIVLSTMSLKKNIQKKI